MPAVSPTWYDHYQLMFWTWAFLRDGEAYLLSCRAQLDLALGARGDPAPVGERMRISNEVELAKYHFVTTLGSMLRVLKRAQHQFPEIQPAYSRANHLLAEGKNLRDMIEHVDDYRENRGKLQDRFLRSDLEIAPDLPGDRGGSVDAISVIVDDRGHWLGGRLNVEQAISEVREICAAAGSIPVPPPPLIT